MKFVNIILVIMVVVVVVTFSSPIMGLKSDIMQQKGFLGAVGNKAFIVERTVGNWAQAKAVCENLGVHLALIETTEEVAFLNSKYRANEFAGLHWTAARDSHLPEQFLWDNTNRSVTTPLNWNVDAAIKDKYLTCAGFEVMSLTSSSMRILACSTTGGHVLCEF